MPTDRPIHVIRSPRRRKTVAGRLRHGRLEILAPQNLTDEQLEPHINTLKQRLEGRLRRQRLDDDWLEQRAQHWNQRLFDGRLSWRSIRWTTRQRRRFGSCCSRGRTIRISARLASVPRYVLDYVIVHELAHLLEPNHGPRFWRYVQRYPCGERARGFLHGLAWSEQRDGLDRSGRAGSEDFPEDTPSGPATEPPSGDHLL